MTKCPRFYLLCIGDKTLQKLHRDYFISQRIPVINQSVRLMVHVMSGFNVAVAEMSNEKNIAPACLMYIGDEILPS